MNKKALVRMIDRVDWRSLGRRVTFQRRTLFSRPWFWTAIGGTLAAAGAAAAIVMKRRRDAAYAAEGGVHDGVDEASWESFPASDPPSFNPSVT